MPEVSADAVLGALSQFLDQGHGFNLAMPESARVVPLSHAGSNMVFLLLERGTPLWVIKVAHEQRRARNLLNEYEARASLQEYIPQLVAEPLAFNESSSRIPLTFLVSQFAAGQTAEQFFGNGKRDAISNVAGEMGSCLAALHRIRGVEFRDSERTIITNWSVYVSERVSVALSDPDLIALLGEALIQRIRSVTSERVSLLKPEFPVFVHKDFQLRNILINYEGYSRHAHLCGILDFESSFWGESEFDFPIIERFVFAQFPEVRPPFLDAYFCERVRPTDFEEKVRFYDVFQTLRLLRRSIRRSETRHMAQHIEYLQSAITGG